MTMVTLKRVKRPRPRGRPRCVWMLRWHAPDGKQPGETIGDCRTMSKREAEAIRRARQGKLDCGLTKPTRPKRMTLAELTAYDRSLIADRRHKTQLGHDHATGHAKRVLGADLRVDRLTRAHVARLKAALYEGDYSPATIDKVIRTLRAMWNRAVREGLVTTDNPFAGNGVKWEPRESRIFEAHEIDAMIETAPDGWWVLFLRLLVTSGLRLNEALHLRWEDVDLDGGTVTVRRHQAGTFTVDGTEYPLLAWSAKAKASYRTIPLPAETVTALRRHKLKAGRSAYVFLDLPRLAALDSKMKAGTWRPNSELVNNALRNFKVMQRKARALLAKRSRLPVDEIDWREGCIHDLRDTYLTGIKGLPLDVLQRVAGHADIATTIRFYTGETARDADAVRAAVKKSGLSSAVQGTLRAHLAVSAG